jgi:hypothetical protein
MQWGIQTGLKSLERTQRRDVMLGIDDVRGDRDGARAETEVAWRARTMAAGVGYGGGGLENGTWVAGS